MNFGEEIEQLRNEQPIKEGNAVKKLNPFMDSGYYVLEAD